MKKLTFANGDEMPVLGLGTWKSGKGVVAEAVREALRIGYRHFDCAAIYGNEAEIGQAFREALASGVVKREELWITSKLWNTQHRRQQVRPALEKTLADLGLDYLDLYLVHWPVALKEGATFPHEASHFIGLDEIPLTETWEGMEAVKEAGLARHIGVSNFSEQKIREILAVAAHRPEMNQVEMHPMLAQNGLVAFCHSEVIHLTAYCPLATPDTSTDTPERPLLLKNPVVTGIAAQKKCTPAQVLLAWAIGRGTSPIPKSVNPARLRENFEAADIELTADEMAEVNALDQHFRFVSGNFWTPPGGWYTLENLWDE